MPKMILIDWGTSSFRLWGVNAQGEIVCEHSSDQGMSKLKPDEYEPLLENTLSLLGVDAGVEVLVCGMAGAAQGWRDAGYLDAPTKLDALAKHAVRVKSATRNVRIIPGIAQRLPETPDVMRGEETLLLGAMVSGKRYETYCMPGTHSKWVSFDDDMLAGFSTFMTGELFALLSSQSTLSHFLKSDLPFELNGSVFQDSVLLGLQHPETLTHELFKFRAAPLLSQQNDSCALRNRLSGLLIGVELAAARHDTGSTVGLISDGVHTQAYSLAFEAADIKYDVLNSKELALNGLLKLSSDIWG